MDVYLDVFYDDEGDPYTVELNDATEDDMIHAFNEAIGMLEDDGHIVEYMEVWPKHTQHEPDYDNESPWKAYKPEDIDNYLNLGMGNCKSIW